MTTADSKLPIRDPASDDTPAICATVVGGDLPASVIDELVANQYWARIEGNLHDLMMRLPRESLDIQRTTILTWMYQSAGVITFGELVDMVQKETPRQRKRHMRQVLRNLQDLNLVTVVNFPDPERGVTIDDNEGVVGRDTMVSLTWAGMVWLRRAWTAREKMIESRNFMDVHELFVTEEDEGKKTSAAWVENLSTRTDESLNPARSSSTKPVPAAALPMRFVFEMGALFEKSPKRRASKKNA